MTSPQAVHRLVGHGEPPKRDDIVEMGRRWQKAWTSHRPGANNCIGDSFGQLTDEIGRLRTALRAVRADPTCAEQVIKDALREGNT